MTQPINITPTQRALICELLQRHLPGVEAWVYGSRVMGNARPQSDLDMVVFPAPAQKIQVSNLRESFEESNLPFRVDLFVWDEVPEIFRENIKSSRVILQGNSRS